ncbi:MAG: tyrosine-type recombinase/integrase [Campylobacteraceae bacterium]|jgi:integrase/recombinase XerD|nr:tyrosine-type recombinase/integrase [Campylobacteraceae bacterium]
MKFPIDCEDDFNSTLLFWICRFVRAKLNSLSNKELQEPKVLQSVILELTKTTKNISQLDALVKKARNTGLTGINTYFIPLKKLYDMLTAQELHSMKQIDEELLSDFLASSTGGLSDASKKNHRMAVLSFFGYIDKQNIDDEGKSHIYDITLKNWGGIVGKKGEKLPEFMSESELKRFLDAVDECPFKKAGLRNRLLVKLIVYTGIRVSEALWLKTKDITEENDCFVLRIRGKGNKYRVVLVKRALVEKELREHIADSLPGKDGLLFCNRNGTKLTQAYVSRIVEQMLTLAGIRKEKNGAHMLRHTFATLLYHRRKDIILVQEALGHASLNTSRIYTHFDSKKLHEAANVAEEFMKDKMRR